MNFVQRAVRQTPRAAAVNSRRHVPRWVPNLRAVQSPSPTRLTLDVVWEQCLRRQLAAEVFLDFEGEQALDEVLSHLRLLFGE